MRVIGRLRRGLEDIVPDFTIEALAKEFGPKVLPVLQRHGKDQQRKSTLTPLVTVWLIIGMTLRREISYHGVLKWLFSGFRRAGWDVAPKLVTDGAVSHARERIGVDVFRDLFPEARDIACPMEPDFHGRVTTAIDGVTMTMPDTPENTKRFGKPGSSRGRAAFPQVRLAGMVQTSVQSVVDVRYGPCRGKGTGERTLALGLVMDNVREAILVLLDCGFYGFLLLHAIIGKRGDFIARAPEHANLKRIRKSGPLDGGYFAWLVGRIEDPRGPSRNGRTRWLVVRHKVRVIEYQIPGFRRVRLVASLCDPAIPAIEIARHYHRRWEMEIAYDSIKTHQCKTRSGECRTILRSKRPDLVEQEILAMLTAYNLVRRVINEAAAQEGSPPGPSVSWTPYWPSSTSSRRCAPTKRPRWLYDQILEDVPGCVMDRWRRPRKYARVVKVKMSNLKLKREDHKELHWDPEKDIRIVGVPA